VELVVDKRAPDKHVPKIIPHEPIAVVGASMHGRNLVQALEPTSIMPSVSSAPLHGIVQTLNKHGMVAQPTREVCLLPNPAVVNTSFASDMSTASTSMSTTSTQSVRSESRSELLFDIVLLTLFCSTVAEPNF
jgi:hypothetical protein